MQINLIRPSGYDPGRLQWYATAVDENGKSLNAFRDYYLWCSELGRRVALGALTAFDR